MASGVEAPFYLLFREGGEGQPVLQGIRGNHRFLCRRPCSDWGLWIGRGQARSVPPMTGCTWHQTSHRPLVALEQDVGPHPSSSFLPWSRTGQRGQCFPTFPPSPSPPLQTGPSDAHNLSGANASLIWGRAFRKNSYELCNALSPRMHTHLSFFKKDTFSQMITESVTHGEIYPVSQEPQTIRLEGREPVCGAPSHPPSVAPALLSNDRRLK